MSLSIPNRVSAASTRSNYSINESTPSSETPTLAGDRHHDIAPTAHPLPPPLWPHRLSASFSAMADQIAAASQALALVPSTAFSGTDLMGELNALRARLDGIEETQGKMRAELESVKMQYAVAQSTGVTEQVIERVTEVGDEDKARIDALEKKLKELSDIVRLDQDRLPARLHNSRATVMKASLKPPVMTNGKPAPGFPSTRGEFEHITKERYDAILKAYSLPLTGDTAAKREQIRAFSGIPQDGQ